MSAGANTRSRRAGSHVVVAVVAALTGACTLGLGDYAARSDRLPATPDVGVPPGGDPGDAGEPVVEPEVDAAAPPVAGGACVEGTLDTTCKVVEGDAGKTCTGSRRCVQSTWSDCKVEYGCPGTWPPRDAGVTICQNTDVKGDSARWTDSVMAGGDVTLWSLDRKASFELYGQVASFCFRPKDTATCIADSKVVVSVECGAKLKLTGQDFLAGTLHNREFCIQGAGSACQIVDTHAAGRWQGPTAAPCERWFESAHWRVTAEPRCSTW
ncbi:MAG TPA: hypothetical protein PLR99_27895 [Polyangiaceae bacterium]|nr:hypothetical protein [Polyangiaceae bacterium]